MCFRIWITVIPFLWKYYFNLDFLYSTIPSFKESNTTFQSSSAPTKQSNFQTKRAKNKTKILRFCGAISRTRESTFVLLAWGILPVCLRACVCVWLPGLSLETHLPSTILWWSPTMTLPTWLQTTPPPLTDTVITLDTRKLKRKTNQKRSKK